MTAAAAIERFDTFDALTRGVPHKTSTEGNVTAESVYNINFFKHICDMRLNSKMYQKITSTS